jgi:hypothetical protein
MNRLDKSSYSLYAVSSGSEVQIDSLFECDIIMKSSVTNMTLWQL